MGEEKSWKLDKTLKIDDDQLKTPEHDRICLWVNKNWKKLFSNHIVCHPYLSVTNIPCDEDKNFCPYNRNKKCIFKKNGNDIEFNFCWEFHNCKFEKVLKLILRDFVLNCMTVHYNCNINWEVPIKNNGFVIGIPDFSIMFEKKENEKEKYLFCASYEDAHSIFIEVKPKIRSLGETLRQLQLYKSYRPDGIFYLVTKSIEYKDIFESQGFNFIGVTDEQLES